MGDSKVHLDVVAKDDDDAVDLCTEASGLLCQIKRQHFFEIGKFLVQVLGLLKPANATLQSQSVDMCRASNMVGTALDSLRVMRDHSDVWEEGDHTAAGDDVPAKRRRIINRHLSDSVVITTVGHTDTVDSVPPISHLKDLY